jgi:sugar phosphate isomerase/epimerase
MLSGISRDYGVKLALENGPESFAGVSSVLKIIREFDPDSLGFCLDLGHANLEPRMNPVKAIEKGGKRLANLHVSDNSGKIDEHNPTGQGKIAWDKVARALSIPREMKKESQSPFSEILFTFELADAARGQPRTLERFKPILMKSLAFFRKFLPA